MSWRQNLFELSWRTSLKIPQDKFSCRQDTALCSAFNRSAVRKHTKTWCMYLYTLPPRHGSGQPPVCRGRSSRDQLQREQDSCFRPHEHRLMRGHGKPSQNCWFKSPLFDNLYSTTPQICSMSFGPIPTPPNGLWRLALQLDGRPVAPATPVDGQPKFGIGWQRGKLNFSSLEPNFGFRCRLLGSMGKHVTRFFL